MKKITQKKNKKRHGQAFWNEEYKVEGHFTLSQKQSEDLEKFTRWLIREYGNSVLNVTASVLDLGTGNGRNLAWLAETFKVRGIGYDISTEAIKQAKQRAMTEGLPLSYESRSIAGTLTVPDESQTVVLDMMTSHFLKEAERLALIDEIYRVLKPGGFLFYKTFLLDEDRHAKRMIKENPAEEANSYIHPEIGVAEHVSSEEEIETLYGEKFEIKKIERSHRHTGRYAKRRSITVYLQKPAF
jgi:ubiquinone/menaquinone biosynthesis C-methylase UbiE